MSDFEALLPEALKAFGEGSKVLADHEAEPRGGFVTLGEIERFFETRGAKVRAMLVGNHVIVEPLRESVPARESVLQVKLKVALRSRARDRQSR